ncbi:aminoacylase [Apostasia shenzhenica]|uniref:Aminoacylase n=1 Tax=Apostasia shenzhenica TaxID=1088818 RepID=A0A2H9ZXV3_9ASPA|nr:aminoacylase [Apostasia shenzhenica]
MAAVTSSATTTVLGFRPALHGQPEASALRDLFQLSSPHPARRYPPSTENSTVFPLETNLLFLSSSPPILPFHEISNNLYFVYPFSRSCPFSTKHPFSAQDGRICFILEWGDFAARVSGEWDGFGADFTVDGKPIELPESVVPEAFREWGVQVYDWQTQCPTLASETTETLFFYKLIKLLPTVGCEADAATRYNVDKRVAGGSENKVLGFGYHPSGRYVGIWPVKGFGGKKILELEHCLVNPKNWEERWRVIQVVSLDEGLISLERISVFSEQWYSTFKDGEQLGGCALRETGFALANSAEVSKILGKWKAERFVASVFEGEEKNLQGLIYELVEDYSHKSVRDEVGLVTLPKGLWSSLRVNKNGEHWAEVGWLLDSEAHAITSTCVFEKDGRLNVSFIFAFCGDFVFL